MDADFFQSWKFTFAMACVMTILGTGYRIVTHHRPAHAASVTFNKYFPDGQPSYELRQHNVAIGVPPSSLDFTLDEMIRVIKAGDGTLDWEPGTGGSVLLKSTMPDPLEQKSVSVAFQMFIADPPRFPASAEFPSGAVVVTAMSVDQELADPDDMQTYLLAVQQMIDFAKGQRQTSP